MDAAHNRSKAGVVGKTLPGTRDRALRLDGAIHIAPK
jgi:hypothetical protein